MTKEQHIKKHPKSELAQKLGQVDWPNNAEIDIIGGLNAPYDKRSNLYKALQGTTGEYCIGGHRMRGTEGWWIAIRL